MNQVVIELKRKKFAGGDTVAGRVIVSLEQATAVRGVRLRLYGYEKSSWTEGRGKDSDTYSETRVLVDEELTLHGRDRLGRGALLVDSLHGFFVKDAYQVLPAGNHGYPFSYRLPAELPAAYQSELTDSRIHYGLKAQVDLPLKRDLQAEQRLEVREPSLPVVAQATTARTTKRFLFNSNAATELVMHLDKDVYVPGERVCCRIEVLNRAPGKEIRAATLVLRQIETSTANGETNEEVREIVRVKYQPSEFPLKQSATAELGFDLPPELPPTMTLGSLVKLNYALQATLDISWAVDPKLSVPIRLVARRPRRAARRS